MQKKQHTIHFPVVCINLKRSQDRRRKIEEWWRPILGKNLAYFDAYDGMDLKARKTLPPLKFFESKSVNTYAASACLASHLEIMKNSLNDKSINLNGMAIMEDDAEPLGNADVFKAVQQAREENPALNILVLTPSLFGGWDYTPKQYVSYPRSQRVKRVGTHFVWYSKKGLEIYLDRFKCFPDFSDAFERLPNDGTMGRLFKPVAKQSIETESTIGYIHGK